MAGNGGNAARWAQLPSPLANDVVLRTINLPGFDGRPLEHSAPTVEDFARWLRQEVESSSRPRVLLGTGIGGSIGFQLAQTPGLVDAYIFHAPVGPDLDTRLLPRLMKPSIIRKAAKHAIGGPAGRLLLRRRFGDTLARSVIDDFAQGYLDCDAFEILWDILTAAWFDSLQPIADPSVLIWGSEDGVLNSDHASGFKRILPKANVIVEPTWGHYPMLERPDHFASTIADVARRLLS